MTGLGTMLRFALRRERVRIPVFLGLMVLFVLSTAIQSEALYPTQAERDAYAETVGANAGMIALVGPARAVNTVGGDTAWQTGALGGVVAALLSMLVIGRHTRAEEQAGRSELVRANVVGRSAPAVAALIVAVLMHVLLAVVVGVALIGQDLDAEGAFALGAAMGAVGIAFAGVALLAAQVTQATSTMYGLVGAVLGGSYILRAAGDVGDGTLSWLSPIGWAQASRPFAGERWWPLLLALAAGAVLAAVALRLLARRDDGAGVIAERPGSAVASGRLLRPGGLALRLGRGSLIGWTVGLFLSGLATGSIAQDADNVLGDSDFVDDIYGQAGGTVIDNYLALTLLSLTLMGTAFAIGAVLRARAEERDGRAEPLLATAQSRTRWAGGHLVLALGGTVAVIGAAGLGAGIADALVAGDIDRLPRLVAASLVGVPAVWVLAGVTMLLVGALPRAASAAWGVLGGVFLMAFLGPLLDLPQWMLDLSPFEHVPLLPAEDFRLGPVLALAAVAAAFLAAGLAALRRRDIATV